MNFRRSQWLLILSLILLDSTKAYVFQNQAQNAIAWSVSNIVNNLHCHFGIGFSTEQEIEVSEASFILSQIFHDTQIFQTINNETDANFWSLYEKVIDIQQVLLEYTKYSQCYLFLVLVTNSEHIEHILSSISYQHQLNMFDFNNYYIFYNPGRNMDSHSRNSDNLIISDWHMLWFKNKIEITVTRDEKSFQEPDTICHIQIYNICFYCGSHNEPIVQNILNFDYNEREIQNLRLDHKMEEPTNNLHGLRFELSATLGPPLSEYYIQAFNRINFVRESIWIYRMGIMLASIGQQMNFTFVENRNAGHNRFWNPLISIYVESIQPGSILQKNYFPVMTIEALMVYFANPRAYVTLFPQFRAFDNITWLFIILVLCAAGVIYTVTEYAIEHSKINRSNGRLRFRRGFTRILFEGFEQSFRLPFTQTVNERIRYKSFSHRYCFIPTFLIFIVVILGSFVGTLIKNETIPSYSYIPQTIQEIALSDFELGIDGGYLSIIQQLTLYKNDGPLSKKIHVLHKLNNTRVDKKANCIAESFSKRKLCILLNSDAAVLTEEFSDVHGNLLYSSGNERIGMVYNVPTSDKYAPFTSTLNSFVYRSLAGGLMNYWYGKELEVFRKEGKRNAQRYTIDPTLSNWPQIKRHSRSEQHQIVLGVEHVKGLFVLLLCGLTLALIIFITEMILLFAIKYKTQSEIIVISTKK